MIRMKLIIYQIRANTMSLTGGVLESLSRQVKKKNCFSLYAVITSQRHRRFFAYIYYEYMALSHLCLNPKPPYVCIYDCIHVCVAIHVCMHTHVCKVDR